MDKLIPLISLLIFLGSVLYLYITYKNKMNKSGEGYYPKGTIINYTVSYKSSDYDNERDFETDLILIREDISAVDLYNKVNAIIKKRNEDREYLLDTYEILVPPMFK